MTDYAIPPGELLAAVMRPNDAGPISVSYYETLTDDDAAAIAAEIIGHQFAQRDGDEMMQAMLSFQGKLQAALMAADVAPADAIESEAVEVPPQAIETETDHGNEDQPSRDDIHGSQGNGDRDRDAIAERGGIPDDGRVSPD